MPSTHELLVLFIAIFALWLVLKVARVAIRLVFVFIAVALFLGVLWFVFVR